MAKTQLTGLTGYLAPEGFVAELEIELGDVAERHGRLLLAPGPPRPVAWVANVWHEPVRIIVESIADAARALRAMQRNWVLYPTTLHRRAGLIAKRLPHVSAKPVAFPAPAPAAPLGSWTMPDAHALLAARQCSSPFPNGVARFVEDKAGPPNRAYLKLWEAFAVIGRRPAPGQLCLDLGASPGGWSWALQRLGARVISVDKAPLDPAIAKLPGISVRRQSAFALEPGAVGPVDWLCSDIVCYPDRLYRLVTRWLDSGLVRNFICTIKFQGGTDFDAMRRFAALPGSRQLHLHHNNHELTWLWPN